MSAGSPGSWAPATDVTLVEARDLIQRLDADNEALRVKVLDLLVLMEEAVTEGVAHERREHELERQLRRVERELVAINNTKLMRVARPVRALYARLVGRG